MIEDIKLWRSLNSCQITSRRTINRTIEGNNNGVILTLNIADDTLHYIIFGEW